MKGRGFINTGGGGNGFDEITSPTELPGLISWIDASEGTNTIDGGSGNVTTAADKSGNGNDFVMPGTVNGGSSSASSNGMGTAAVATQYPDPSRDIFVDLPSITAFNRATDQNRILRCEDLMTGLSSWTIASIIRPSSVYDDSGNDAHIYYGLTTSNTRAGLRRRSSVQPVQGFISNGVTAGASGAHYIDENLWTVVVQSHTPSSGSLTLRHVVMINGVAIIVGKNTTGLLEDDSADANYLWPKAVNDYTVEPMTDLSIGGVRIDTLSSSFTNTKLYQKNLLVFNRALSNTQMQQLTSFLYKEIYPTGTPAFLNRVHHIGDSISNQQGALDNPHGYWWLDLPKAQKAATTIHHTAEGGNTIETQGKRALASANKMRKYHIDNRVIASICAGTNDAETGANTWAEMEASLNDLAGTGIYNGFNVGTLLVNGTGTAPYTENAGRCGNHDDYNVLIRAELASGGDYQTANPGIFCQVLDYAASIPSYYTTSDDVLNPDTPANVNKQISDTNAEDIANEDTYHMVDFLHPQYPIYPIGNHPIFGNVGEYEELNTKLENNLGYKVIDPRDFVPELWYSPIRTRNSVMQAANQFTASNSQQFKGASNTDLTGDVNFTGIAWVYLDNTTNTKVITSKAANISNQRAWNILQVSSTDRAQFRAWNSSDVSTAVGNTANTALGTAAWAFVVFGHDADNNEIFIQVNNGTEETAAFTAGGMNSITRDLMIGARDSSLANPELFWDGRIGPVVFFDKVLSASERTALYNSGGGRTLAEIPAALAGNIVEYYALSGSTGAEVGQVNSTSLAASASRPTIVAGGVEGISSAGDPLETLTDLSANSNDATQATLANQPVLTASGINSKNVFSFDGTNDDAAFTAVELSHDFTLAMVIDSDDVTARTYIGHSSTTGYVQQTTATTLTISNDAASTLVLTHSTLDTNPHILSIVREDDTVSLYIDGTLEDSGTLTGDITLDTLGNRTGGSSYDGYMGDVLLTKRALSAVDRSNLEYYLGRSDFRYGITVV